MMILKRNSARTRLDEISLSLVFTRDNNPCQSEEVFLLENDAKTSLLRIHLKSEQ